jgi:diguanylate cyclase (GGDEF)-like protein
MAKPHRQPLMTDSDPLLRELLGAQDLASLADVARRGLQSLGLDEVKLIWSPLPGSNERWHTLSGDPPNAAVLALLDKARRDGRRGPSPREDGSQSGRFVQMLAQNAGLWMAVSANALPNRATPNWQNWLQPLGQRCQSLLHTLRLQVDVERLANAERLQRALYTISDIVSSDLSTTEVLHSLHQVVGRLMYAENFYIVRFDPTLETIRFIYFADSYDAYPPAPDQVFLPEEMSNSLTLAMLRHGKPVRGASVDIRAKLDLLHEDVLGPDSVDWLGVPIVEDGVVRGGVVVQSYDAAVRYNEDDQALLGYVAQHILSALSRREVQEELERRVEVRTHELREEIIERQRGEKLQRALYRIAELSISSDSLPSFYASVHEIVGELLEARNFYIALLTPDGQELDFPYSIDDRDRRLPRRKLGRGLSEYVLRTGKPLLTDRARVDALEAAGEVVSTGTKSVCWLGVPLQIAGKVIGLITVQSYTPDYLYTWRDEELLSFVSFHIANALERRQVQESLRQANAELEQRVVSRTSELADTNRELRNQILVRERVENKLKHEAMHDSLTGLPNRNQLLATLDQTLARYHRDPEQVFAVLFLDLDRFKVVNDSVGHLVGDELLKEAARRISHCIRAPDSVARLGGDEFAIVIDLIRDPADAVMVAERLIRSLTEPMRIAGKELYTSASVGIALAHDRYRQPEELLRDADVAMYRAKAAGRQRFALFDEYLHEDALRQLELEGDLRRALLREEFAPYYQPIVRLSDSATVGFEALARWLHPERGCLEPSHFLPTAEETGTLAQIDWQIYEQVCRDIRRLDAAGAYVTINVSPRHLRTPDFADRLLGLLKIHGVRPEAMRLEITEGALLENPEQVEQCLAQLSIAGVHTLLDDFGTGYSSLSYLHRFSLYGLKIDRSFVSALQQGESGGSTAIIRAIRLMADSLGLEVVAEGIETEDQRQQLRLHGLTLGQGYLFARPVPIDAIAAHHFSRPAARR